MVAIGGERPHKKWVHGCAVMTYLSFETSAAQFLCFIAPAQKSSYAIEFIPKVLKTLVPDKSQK